MADAGAIIQKLASLLCIIPRRNRPGADLELEPRGYSVPRLIARRFARRRVRMDVDETRRRDEAARVDHAPPLQRRLADGYDPVAVDRHITFGIEPGFGIDHPRADIDDVMHGDRKSTRLNSRH